MNYKVKTLPAFERDLKKLAKKYPSLKSEFFQLVESLKEQPQQGTALGKECYKIRLAIASKQKGKSGGARVITTVYVAEEKVYLLSIYDKSEKENLTDKEIQVLLQQINS